MKHSLFLIALSIILVACGGSTTEQKATADNNFQERCNQAVETCNQLENAANNLPSDLSYENVSEVQRMAEQLTLEYEASSLDSAQLVRAQEVEKLIADVKRTVNEVIDQTIKSGYWHLVNQQEALLTETTEYPVYLERGERLFVNITTEKPADVRIYNTNSHQLLKTYTGKKIVRDSVAIRFAAVYLVEINPKGRQYANLDISFKPNSVNRAFETKTVEAKEVEGQKGDFRVKAIPGINMQNLFEEPRKFTLRSQLKAAFSSTTNADRAIVAIQVPTGTKDVMYSLRISTNEGSCSSDGHFSDNLAKSYKKIKFLGIPLYERNSTHGSSLFELLLGENQPPREEEAYINMYVFYNATQAKKFQDGADPAKLQYSIDYSTMGTQSCNGRIPTKGNNTIYMGYQNERVRYNNYVWLEAVSAVPNTEYLKTEYIVH